MVGMFNNKTIIFLNKTFILKYIPKSENPPPKRVSNEQVRTSFELKREKLKRRLKKDVHEKTYVYMLLYKEVK